MEDEKPFKIEVLNDESGEIVKKLEYKTSGEREKAYSGLLRNMNTADFTARYAGKSS